MTTALIAAAVLAPFLLAALLIRAARRTGRLRITLDQFRIAAPLAGSFDTEDRDNARDRHDISAIGSRFEAWPQSGATGERR